MTEREFLTNLRSQLSGLPDDQIEEALAFYAEAVADRMDDGMTEREAVDALGDPGSAAESILRGLPLVPRTIARTRGRGTLLLGVLAIIGSPIWLSLGVAFLAIVAAGYIVLWSLALCAWIVTAALFGIVPLLGVLSLDGLIIGNLPYAVVSIGFALLAAGIALFAGLIAWEVSKLILRLSALWVRKAFSPFVKGRGVGPRTDPALPRG